MKNSINSIYIFLILIFISCNSVQDNKKEMKKTEIKIKKLQDKTYNQKLSYIDYESDNTIYKLDICSEKNARNFLQDDRGNETLLLTRRVFIGDSCFGAYSNIKKALIYSKKMNKLQEGFILISINIQNKDKIFNEAWFWKQPITIGELEGELIFSELGGKIFLDEGHYNYKNHNEIGFKISYNYEFPDYYKLNTLNFINENNKWKIISRESFNTSPEASKSYFIETTNLNGHYSGELSDTFPPAEKIEITDEMINF